MKLDNPKTGEECLDVPERSIILLELWDLQIYELWSVFMREKIIKKIMMPELVFFSFNEFFAHTNTPKLIILEVPQPQEYDRTLWDIETLLPSFGVIKFHGLGPDL